MCKLGLYGVLHRFSQAKFPNDDFKLQFLLPTQLSRKMKLASKVVKIDSKIIISKAKILSQSYQSLISSFFQFSLLSHFKIQKIFYDPTNNQA